jgi:hypothetical protein
LGVAAASLIRVRALGIDVRLGLLESSKLRRPVPCRTSAAPPITKPSRSASNGRLAAAGSSFRRESARMAAKPAIPAGVIAAAAPPQNITSARPSRIASRPSPIAIWELHRRCTGSRAGRAFQARSRPNPRPSSARSSGSQNGLTRRNVAPQRRHCPEPSDHDFPVSIDAGYDRRDRVRMYAPDAARRNL